MRSLLVLSALLFASTFSFGAFAESATYGDVVLQGPSRNSGSLKPPGYADVMVCNVNGSDKFLAVRSGPGSEFATVRKLERLVILTVDSTERSGRWIYVTAAHRSHTKNGEPLPQIIDLQVQGWVYDSYLCDFYIP